MRIIIILYFVAICFTNFALASEPTTKIQQICKNDKALCNIIKEFNKTIDIVLAAEDKATCRLAIVTSTYIATTAVELGLDSSNTEIMTSIIPPDKDKAMKDKIKSCYTKNGGIREGESVLMNEIVPKIELMATFMKASEEQLRRFWEKIDY